MELIKQNIIDDIKEIITNLLISNWPETFKLLHSLNQMKFNVEKTKKVAFGDFTTNVLMFLKAKVDQKDCVEKFVDLISKHKFFAKVVVQGSFLNLFLNKATIQKYFHRIIDQKDQYGQFASKKLHYEIEFVSANPTGLLHIGHARNGCYGDTITRVWKKYGIDVTKEYYVNDGGNQIQNLGLSVLVRYLELFDKKFPIPKDGYHGKEIIEVAKALKERYEDEFLHTNFNENAIVDQHPRDLICRFAVDYLLGIIADDLKKLNVEMDLWYNESKIYTDNLIDQALKKLAKYIYQKDGATWLKTTQLGDDKDRVLIKSDKTYTYFMPDIAYHDIKLSRKYDKIFCVWGADHRSYVERMSIAISLLNYPKGIFHVMIMQMVHLLKNGQEFKMSKRSGESFTLRDLYSLIGYDSCRWYLVNQSLNTHLEIDIDKVTKKNSENGLYYVQYAYVRIIHLLQKAKINPKFETNLLNLDIERELINQIFFFPVTIANVAKTYEVNKICLYLYNLAKMFHSYYETVVINDSKNEALSAQRLGLISAINIVLKNGLGLLAIVPKEEM